MLPKLPDLDLDKELKKDKKKVEKESKVDENTIKDEKEEKKSILPKSRYDDNGDPILTVPDLNDIDLTEEIDKYFYKFGQPEEDDEE